MLRNNLSKFFLAVFFISTSFSLSVTAQQNDFSPWEDYVNEVKPTELLTDEVFQLHPEIDKVYLALGWDPGPGNRSIDIDSNVHVIKKNKGIIKRVSFQNLTYKTGKLFSKQTLIQHKGDNITGKGEGDDETITINLKKISQLKPSITDLVSTIVSYSGDKFSKLSNAFCRIYIIDKSGNQKELARYALNDLGPVKGLIFANFHKQENGRWYFKAIGETLERARLASDFDKKIMELKNSSQLQ